jgi:hypothetical protein
MATVTVCRYIIEKMLAGRKKFFVVGMSLF